jgi:hypothetical protein
VSRALALAVLLAAAGPAAAQDRGPVAALEAVEQAWNSGNAAAYLALWDFSSADAEQAEREFVGSRPAAGARLTVHVPDTGAVPLGRGRLSAYADLVTVDEPWGRVEQILFTVERRDHGFRLVRREAVGQIDGLVHLSLDPGGLKAAGHVLRLPDFELQMRRGTLFTSPAAAGRTVLVFVGDGHVRFRPHVAREREQLRKFAGRPELDRRVRLAFVRIAPSALERVLSGPPLAADPEAALRWEDARRFYDAHAESAFVLDAPMPGSPWWLVPPPGDALVVFDQRGGPLTLSISTGRAEGISLFDRGQRRQICLYPEEGRPRDFDEDEGRVFDVVHQDVKVRLDPATYELRGEARLRLNLLEATPNIRLRLNESLHVDGVSSDDGRRFLFFRVRNQHTLMVALPSGLPPGALTLNVRYRGFLKPPPFERENTRPTDPGQVSAELENLVPNDRVSVYSQPAAWYPQAENDDFATATVELDLPDDFAVIGPGRRTVTALPDRRALTRLVVDRPVKHVVVAVGRLVEAGDLVEGGVTIRTFSPPRMKGEAQRTLSTAAAVLRLFTQEFGPFPYETIQIVLLESTVPGGHSPPGVVLLVRRPLAVRALIDDPASFADVPGFFLAHELAHQWWGDGVAGRSYHERWISEAMSQYAASQWVRASRGESAFREVMDDMGQWALRMNGAGPMILGHRLGHLEGDSRLFRAVVYDKGARVLHMLRRITGADAFARGLQRFQQTYRFAKAGTGDFRECLEQAANLDLTPYFESWIYGTELPRLRLSYASAGRTEGPDSPAFRTTVTIDAKELPGPLPVEITLRHPEGRETHVETMTSAGASWEYRTPSEVRGVQINEDRALLARRE